MDAFLVTGGADSTETKPQKPEAKAQPKPAPKPPAEEKVQVNQQDQKDEQENTQKWAKARIVTSPVFIKKKDEDKVEPASYSEADYAQLFHEASNMATQELDKPFE